MKPIALLLALPCAGALAQGGTDYALNGGRVHFQVPAGWTAMMEKSEGDPQAIAFQVPDASAQGSEDAANVTVKTRQLKDAGAFAGTVQEELEHARGQAGYENDVSNKDASVHRYFVTRGKTRYLVRDSFWLTGDIAVEVRCQRPLLPATPEGWNATFDGDCDGVVASLKR